MTCHQDYMLLSLHNQAGWNFAAKLKLLNIPFAVLVNHDNELERLEQFGIEHVVKVDIMEKNNQFTPDFPIGNIYLFEQSASLCCRFIERCRPWASKSIYVILNSSKPETNFKSIEADRVIYTKSDDVSFLLMANE